MKLFKKMLCVGLTLTVVLGLTACGAKLSHKKLVQFFESEKFDDYDDSDDFIGAYGRIAGGRGMEEGAYITCTKRDAQDIYDTVFNRFNQYPDYDVIESTAYAYNDEDGMQIGYLFTFEEAKKAEKLFKKYSKEASDCEEGTKNGVSYILSCGEARKGSLSFTGVYFKDDMVLIVRGLTKETELTDDLCKTFGLISPSTVEED